MIASTGCAGGMRGLTIKGVVRKNRMITAGTSIMTMHAIIITSNVNQDGANTTTRELAAATFDDEKTFDEGNAQKNWRMVQTRIAISTTTAKITSAGGMRGHTIKGVVIKNRIITAGTSIHEILAIMKTSNVNQNGAMVRDAHLKRIPT